MGCATSKQARRNRQRSPSLRLLPTSFYPVLPRRLDSQKSASVHGHYVSLTSSTLGSLEIGPSAVSSKDESMKDSNQKESTVKSWSEMIEQKIPKVAMETINAWELMEGLEDAKEEEEEPESPSKSNNGKNDEDIGLVKKRVSAFEAKIGLRRRRCPPRGEGRVVVYFTSLRGVRKTYEDCSLVRSILRGYGVRLDERDVSMHGGFKEELRELLGTASQVDGGFRLPRLFANGRYIGGVEEVRRMHEASSGELVKVLAGCEMAAAAKGGGGGGDCYFYGGWSCDGCGGARFVPCDNCSGSCKVFVEERDDDDGDKEKEEEYGEEEKAIVVGGRFRRCPECNENGLVRCPVCF